ncbi:MAG: hypothetical protein RLZZ244_1836, partial [Verrucomicrobiota bacterium]
QLASHWNLHSIRAVSNDRHIYRSLRKRREIQSDYDGFWTENGGSLDSDGNFLLPIVPEKKVIADLKPNKRTVYRKRYAWMESLSAEIRHALGPQTPETSLSNSPSQNE